MRARSIPVTALKNHTVLIGYGRVGRLVGEALAAVHRHAAAPDVLKAADIAHAASLVVAIPNGFEAGQIVEQTRAANPTIEIIARAHSDAEVEHLRHYGVDLAIMGEREIARGMIGRLLPAAAEPVRATSSE